MLTLDEAIKHAEEKAREINNKALKDFSDNKTTFNEMISCRECASEHLQLAKWLKELKAYKEKENRDCSTCARYSEFQKEIPKECESCKHNYFSNYKE